MAIRKITELTHYYTANDRNSRNSIRVIDKIMLAVTIAQSRVHYTDDLC